MALIIKKRGPKPPPDPLVTPSPTAGPVEKFLYIDPVSKDYEQLIRAFARMVAIADHEAEHGRE